MKKTYKGFTLIELLVVIAIIGVLIALLAPAIASTRTRSQIAVCVNNMRQLGMAMSMYADDHNSIVPAVTDTANYVQDDSNIFKCPRDARSGIGISKPSYTAWKYTPEFLLPAGISGVPCETIVYFESDKEAPKDQVTKNDIVFRHEGSAVALGGAREEQRTVLLFADGHTMSYSKAQLAALQGLAIDDIILEDPGK